MGKRPWNWCHKCKQPVDAVDVSDGSDVRCWGCMRWFTVVQFGDGSGPVDWALFSESQRRRMTTKMNKRHREAGGG